MVKTKVELFELIEDNTGVSGVKEDSKLIDDLGFDSLDMVELQMLLEDEFEIQIQDAEVEKILSVSEIIEYLKTRDIILS
jgi:acyl carrier protein